MPKNTKQILRSLRLRTWFYATVCLLALWVVAYALTGDILRACLFCAALFLLGVAYLQYQISAHTAGVVQRHSAFLNNLDQINKEK